MLGALYGLRMHHSASDVLASFKYSNEVVQSSAYTDFITGTHQLNVLDARAL